MTLREDPDSSVTWMNQWATREFGASLSTSVASIIDKYGRYAARRKYELLDATVYSIINYDEGDNVLTEWTTPVSEAQTIYDSLPASFQPAFFELVLHPAKSGYILYQLYASTAKNNLYAEQGRVSAAVYAMLATNGFAADAALATTYHKLLLGKWDHMMDQTHIGHSSWQELGSNVMPSQSTATKSTGYGVFSSHGSIWSYYTVDRYLRQGQHHIKVHCQF